MFLETSAKTAYNVVEAFNLSASCILNNIEKNGVDPYKTNNKIDLKKNMNTQNGDNNKKPCC
jgi:AAA15 family ATPase/GTPase